jgi:hypothetical protein
MTSQEVVNKSEDIVKNICILLIVLLAFNRFALADQPPQARETTQVEKVKEQVQKRGTEKNRE